MMSRRTLLSNPHHKHLWGRVQRASVQVARAEGRSLRRLQAMERRPAQASRCALLVSPSRQSS